MIRRILYLVVIWQILYLNIMYDWSAGRYVLAVLVILPVLGEISVIAARNKLKVSVRADKGIVRQNESVKITIRFDNRAMLWSARCRLKIRIGQPGVRHGKSKWTEYTVPRGLSKESSTIIPKHCGVLEIAPLCLELCDCFLLGFTCSKPGDEFQVAVLPESVRMPLVITAGTRMFQAESDEFSQEAGGDDPSEVFGLREYRPGDRAQQIHWKLSSRMDEWYVKEFSRPLGTAVVLFMKRPVMKTAELDAYLQTAVSMMDSLLERECQHRICWAEAGTRELRMFSVRTQEDAFEAAAALTLTSGRELAGDITELYEEAHGRHYHTAFCLDGTLTLYKNETAAGIIPVHGTEEYLRHFDLEV